MPVLTSNSEYRVRWKDEVYVIIVNHRMVAVNDLAAAIWEGDTQSKTAVRTKARKAYDKDLLHRLPFLPDATYAHVNDVEEWMRTWCRRSEKAKAALANFSFADFKLLVLVAHRDHLAAKCKRLLEQIDVSNAKRQRLQGELVKLVR